MAFTAKLTAQRGKVDLKDIALAAGSSEAQRDTISLNIDADKLTKGEALILIDKIRHKIHASPWPPA